MIAGLAGPTIAGRLYEKGTKWRKRNRGRRERQTRCWAQATLGLSSQQARLTKGTKDLQSLEHFGATL
jgi:hypothetical protein